MPDRRNNGSPEKTLRQIDRGLWVLDSHFVTMGCNGSLRMSVIETPDGLILYSPVALTPAHVEQLSQIGRVSRIIAPNLYHHLFVREVSALYPDATVLVPDGLVEKIGPIERSCVIGPDTVIDVTGEVDHFTFEGHQIRETILYHAPSRTLITADLIYHYTKDQFPAERTWFWLLGCYGRPKIAFYHRFSIRSKASLRGLLAAVQAWDIRRIVMSHGRIYDGDDAGRIFTEAWRRLG